MGVRGQGCVEPCLLCVEDSPFLLYLAGWSSQATSNRMPSFIPPGRVSHSLPYASVSSSVKGSCLFIGPHWGLNEILHATHSDEDPAIVCTQFYELQFLGWVLALELGWLTGFQSSRRCTDFLGKRLLKKTFASETNSKDRTKERKVKDGQSMSSFDTHFV